LDLEDDAPTRPDPSCWEDQMPNYKRENFADKLIAGETQNESFKSIVLSPKKVARSTSRKMNIVTHLASLNK
jgi:hypothetical protein